nr:EOG090X0AVB [Lepidurus arcticus]
MLYIVGLGLGDAQDITVRGLDVVKKADKVYLEAYTSILTVGKEALEEFYGREIIVADRVTVEQGADEFIKTAQDHDVAFLVVGDPFGATTHTDLVLRAKEAGVNCQIIHNASILNAVGCTGLQLYSFGETVSIPFWTDDWEPDSFMPRIEANLARGLHTLCLLDIKVKEQSLENIMRNRPIFEPPRFMTVAQGAGQLVKALGKNQYEFLSTDTLTVGVARVGSPSQQMVANKLANLVDCDLGGPLHCMVIVGKTHPLETDFMKTYAPNLGTLLES